jgi:hypothetical protein
LVNFSHGCTSEIPLDLYRMGALVERCQKDGEHDIAANSRLLSAARTVSKLYVSHSDDII